MVSAPFDMLKSVLKVGAPERAEGNRYKRRL